MKVVPKKIKHRVNEWSALVVSPHPSPTAKSLSGGNHFGRDKALLPHARAGPLMTGDLMTAEEIFSR